MSLGCGFLENIPHFTFTPSEHQVECARISQDKNVTYVLTNPHEKSFLALMAIKARSNSIRAGKGKAAVLLYSKHQVSLWTGFLARMTDLLVEEVLEDIDIDTGQVLGRVERGGVIVCTHSSFSNLVSRKLINLASFNLVVVDNLQASLKSGSDSVLLSAYRNIPKNRAPRLVFFLPNILTSNSVENQQLVPRQLSRLEKLLPAAVECSCEITTQLRFLARPVELISLFKKSDKLDTLEVDRVVNSEILFNKVVKLEPELQIRMLAHQAKDWFEDHNYSLYDTYGEEFGDLIADIPDPTATPLRLIADLLHVLDELGLWSTDRAALLLMIKIEKLKTREKYERHFLLLSVLFTLMLKIRKICDDYFGELSEFDKIVINSRPKMIKLIDLLGNYSRKVKPAEPVKLALANDSSTDPETKLVLAEDNSTDAGTCEAAADTSATTNENATDAENITCDDGTVEEKTDDNVVEVEAADTDANNETDDVHDHANVQDHADVQEQDADPKTAPDETSEDLPKTENIPAADEESSDSKTDNSALKSDHCKEDDGEDKVKIESEQNEVKLDIKKDTFGTRKKAGGRRQGPIPEDPESLCSILLVNSVFAAKIIYHFLKDLSRSDERYSFLCPQYCIKDPVSTDQRDVENEKKKREETLRRFRMRECNILVSSDVLEEGIDFVKCNFVMLFDKPTSFNRYIYSKVKCKSVFGTVVYLSTPEDLQGLEASLGTFKRIEADLLNHCSNRATDPQEDLEADKLNHLLPAYPQSSLQDGSKSKEASSIIKSDPTPSEQQLPVDKNHDGDDVDDAGKAVSDAGKPTVPEQIEASHSCSKVESVNKMDEPAASTDVISEVAKPTRPVTSSRNELTKIPALTLNTSILVLNRYCAKLPSDTFTRLTPIWTIQRTTDDKFFCALFLPINSPLKDLVVGNVMPTSSLARRAAAYQACVVLHKMGELDNNMIPLGKETVIATTALQRQEMFSPESMSSGTTKRRQYYYKRVAPCLIRGDDHEQSANEGMDDISIPKNDNIDKSDMNEVTNVSRTEACEKKDDSLENLCSKLTISDKIEASPLRDTKTEIDIEKSNDAANKTEHVDVVKPEEEKSNSTDAQNRDNISKVDETLELEKAVDETPELSESNKGVESQQVDTEDTTSQKEKAEVEVNETSREDEIKSADKEEDYDDEEESEEFRKLISTYPNIRYYQKRMDQDLRDRYENIEVPEEATYSLYSLRMRLTCPIPEEQNTRGRKIHDPAESNQLFGLLMPNSMPVIPAFPIYTRSGEVLVETELVDDNVKLSKEELSKVFTYHVFIFYSVLRLEKYPMVFNSAEEHNCVVVVPLIKAETTTGESANKNVNIDWKFLELITYLSTRRLRSIRDAERRQRFMFNTEQYKDAVIMPWYRNQDQPQYFYVAEICHHLDPTSDFPGQGFETFEKYYGTKYGINIQNLKQPLLDVDHTSARLNFLTPRYVNRKGIALPTSSEETKRNKRENLDQKQILVPELCAIHPFSASLWRQTVALPCTLYRLNGLLIADQIRHKVSLEMRMGPAILNNDFKWPALNFGWTLADVVKNSRAAAAASVANKNKEGDQSSNSGGNAKRSRADGAANKTVADNDSDMDENESSIGTWGDENIDMGKVNEQLMSKLAAEERLQKKKKMEIGTWDNTMANQGPAWGGTGSEADGEEGESEDDDLMADLHLPDNLTFLNSKKISKVSGKEGTANWVTGIESKNFRVGSPTCFSNANMAGLMDDLAGFSCSDSEDDWMGEDEGSDSDGAGHPGGQGRIEFHGENLAEAIEEEEAAAAREERQAKDRDQEASMVQEVEWDPCQLLADEEGDDNENFAQENGDLLMRDIKVYDENQTVRLLKPHNVNKTRLGTVIEGSCETIPDIPSLQEQADLDTVLANISLSPDLAAFAGFSAKTEPGVIPWPGVDQDIILFDQQPDLADHPGPSPSLILQALTMSNSNDAINLERLETIGDSFLKYAITSYLYCQRPDIHEGKLSHLRSKQVSNLNLYTLGRAAGLGECMIATKFEPHDNWLPPCYHVPRELEKALIESGVPSSHWNMADLPGVDKMSSLQICQLLKEKCERTLDTEDIQDLPSFVPYNLLTQHSIPDKSIADCVEALIGAYLISCGPRGALLLMTWLGLDVLPGARSSPGYLAPPSSPIISSPWITEPEKHLAYLLDGYSKFEQMIGYVWKDKSYLLQAFSHASYTPNRLTDCYQRLEFLGDAVLDYLITRYLYQDSRLHSPGALTDLRSALVNNTIFACLAVRHDFHKYFKHQSPGLQLVCDRFVRIQAENGWKVSEDCYLIDEDETEEAEDIEVPKALGDIFESVAGSIYLDSGLSLDAVWRVYYRMMKDEIEQFSSHVPKSPIRELLELEPETAKFGKPEKLADGRRVRVSVEVFGKGVYKGIGRNYRIAKCTAAKCALKALRKMEARNKKK